ncbi:MAG TPA: hypothetical protein VFZ26_12645, partial [Gemmatimonadales bacterium]
MRDEATSGVLPRPETPAPVRQTLTPTLHRSALPAPQPEGSGRRWLLAALAAALVIGGLVLAWRPEPVLVDLGAAERGALVVTVDEDGRTRVKDR